MAPAAKVKLRNHLRAAQERHQNQRTSQASAELFAEFRFEPGRYIQEKLGWTPWSGTEEFPGQQEVIDAYTQALLAQHERQDFEAGVKAEAELTVWKPETEIQNWIRVEAGHSVGKTKMLSGLVNHFFDCFPPAIIYTFAPTWKQIHDLLWKEIKSDRRGKGLPGRILDLELKVSDDHFANGVAASNAGGNGTERVQGQHGQYLMFVIDEAEGVADYVFDAVNSMASGGIAVVILCANPRTRASRFYRIRTLGKVRSFRINCIGHPNVLQGREIVRGAVRRDYVQTMMEEHCQRLTAHSEDDHTFEIPWRPGVIWKPDPEFLFRVMGIAPKNLADNTLIPVGRYERALARAAQIDRTVDAGMIRMGIDVARWGTDVGTIYIRQGMLAWRAARIAQADSSEYVGQAKSAAIGLAAAEKARRAMLTEVERNGLPPLSLHIRIDAGGGFGGGVIDQLKNDPDLIAAFADFRTFEVNFGGKVVDETAYHHSITEITDDAGESLKGIGILDPPNELEGDLCERAYKWVNIQARAVKQLTQKDDFKKLKGRSPDDGDGFVLAVASDFLFTGTSWTDNLDRLTNLYG